MWSRWLPALQRHCHGSYSWQSCWETLGCLHRIIGGITYLLAQLLWLFLVWDGRGYALASAFQARLFGSEASGFPSTSPPYLLLVFPFPVLHLDCIQNTSYKWIMLKEWTWVCSESLETSLNIWFVFCNKALPLQLVVEMKEIHATARTASIGVSSELFSGLNRLVF